MGRTPGIAGRGAIQALARDGGFAGVILVDRLGRTGACFNTPRMARGFADERGISLLVDAAERRR
ncbi:hypothetical protein D3C83_329140 [compost metagenome]